MGYINNGKARSYTIRITQTIGGIPITFYPPMNMLQNFPGSGGAITEIQFLRLTDAEFLTRVNAYYAWLESVYDISLPEDLSVGPEIDDPSCLDATTTEPQEPTTTEPVEPPTTTETPGTEEPQSTEDPGTTIEPPSTTIYCYTCDDELVQGEYEGFGYYMYPLVNICSDGDCGQFNWNVIGRPNRFTIYDGSSPDYIFTTGWKGYADYPGPWGMTLSTGVSGNDYFEWGSSTSRYVMVEAGPADPDDQVVDEYNWSITCLECSTTTIETTQACTPVIVRLTDSLEGHCSAEYVIKYIIYGETLTVGTTVYNECELLTTVVGNFISGEWGVIHVLLTGVVGVDTGLAC